MAAAIGQLILLHFIILTDLFSPNLHHFTIDYFIGSLVQNLPLLAAEKVEGGGGGRPEEIISAAKSYHV